MITVVRTSRMLIDGKETIVQTRNDDRFGTCETLLFSGGPESIPEVFGECFPEDAERQHNDAIADVRRTGLKVIQGGRSPTNEKRVPTIADVATTFRQKQKARTPKKGPGSR